MASPKICWNCSKVRMWTLPVCDYMLYWDCAITVNQIRMTMGSEPPVGCPKAFEHAVSAGMPKMSKEKKC